MRKEAARGNPGDKGAEAIRWAWGDMDVIDAQKDLRVFISPEDIEGAEQKDPGHCIFARACRRTFHSTKVLFFRSVAYVDLPDETGRRHVERFLVDSRIRDMILDFDRGNPVLPEGGFLLRAPKPSKTLKSEIRRSRDRDRARRRRLEGEAFEAKSDGRGRGKYRDEPLLVDLSVRSGAGMVHFARRTSAGSGE